MCTGVKKSVKRMFCLFLLDLRTTETFVLLQKQTSNKVSVGLLLKGPKNQEENMFTKIYLSVYFSVTAILSLKLLNPQWKRCFSSYYKYFVLYMYMYMHSHYICIFLHRVRCISAEAC